MEGLRVRTGVDLVKLADFRTSLQSGGEAFLRRLFHPSERNGASLERLAGIFARERGSIQGAGAAQGGLARH